MEKHCGFRYVKYCCNILGSFIFTYQINDLYFSWGKFRIIFCKLIYERFGNLGKICFNNIYIRFLHFIRSADFDFFKKWLYESFQTCWNILFNISIFVSALIEVVNGSVDCEQEWIRTAKKIKTTRFVFIYLLPV